MYGIELKKITRHIKEENTTYNEKKNQTIKQTDPEMTKTTDFVEKERYGRDKKQTLQIKSTMCEMKNTLHEIND